MKIKLCGMFRDCDIDYANEAKPDYIGFILGFPKSHRNIDAETARRLCWLRAPGFLLSELPPRCAALCGDGAIRQSLPVPMRSLRFAMMSAFSTMS